MALTKETAMRLNHAQGHNQEDPMKSHALYNLCVLSIWWEASTQRDSAPLPHLSPTYPRNQALTGPEFIGTSSGEGVAGTGRPGHCVNAVTFSGCAGVCPRASHLRRSASAAANGRAFVFIEMLREKRILQCGTVRSSKDGDNLRCFRMWPIWWSASDRGGRTSRSAGSRGYSASRFACPIRLSHLSCVRTPHMLADGAI